MNRQASIDQERLATAVARLPDDGLAALRARALDRFRTEGLPTVRQENWKYTNLAPAAEVSNAWLERDGAAASDLEPAALTGLTSGVDAYWLGIHNGRVDPASLAALAGLADGGVRLELLSSDADESLLRIDDPVSSLNAALLRDGIRIRVGDGVALDKPIGLLVADRADGGPAVSQARIVIELGTGASAAFVERQHSEGDQPHFSSTVVQLALGAGSRAEYLRLQSRKPEHLQVGRLIARLGRDAVLRHAAVDLGGRLVRNDVLVELPEPGADAELLGVYLADGEQHVDNHLCADHRVGPARSKQHYRGIVAGRARAVFNGKAVVREGADGTDAEQANHNLLLSDTAEVDTKPELEIYADDVKCSHGTTVGQLDERSLFYLRSRGLARDEAERILTRAFAGQVLAALPVEAARAATDDLIERKLNALTGVPAS